MMKPTNAGRKLAALRKTRGAKPRKCGHTISDPDCPNCQRADSHAKAMKKYMRKRREAG